MGGCSCSKNSQPTGFAKQSTPRQGAQATQRAGAASVPGAVASGPLRSVSPTTSSQ